jgi:glycoside/pentoside/hexuronide:cation symporter, GPH family
VSKEPHEQSTAGNGPQARLKVRTKLAFGFGGFLDNIGQHGLNALAYPVLNVALGINPALIGVAMTVFRLWDAFTDPAMGAISDATRSRWGRRRPWMFVGAILTGALFPLLWWASPSWGTPQQVAYFIGIGILYFTAFTMYSVPYHALAFEMTPDYHEKTNVMAYRTTINGIAAIATGWLYALTQLPVFGGDTVLGARYSGIAVGLFIAVCGLVPALMVKERYFAKVSHERPVRFFESLKLTLGNVPFRMVAFMGIIILGGDGITKSIGLYLNIYYVHLGETAPASVITGAMGTVFAILSVVLIPAMAWLSHRIGKHETVTLCLGLCALSSVANWFCITPAYPWLQLLPIVFSVPGIMGFWLMFSSMTADVCDDDELKTGSRREGMFSAVYAWVAKVAISLALGLGGVVISLTGFHQSLGGDQPASAMLALRIIYTVVPVLCYGVAFVALRRYPLNHEVMAKTRAALEERRGKY